MATIELAPETGDDFDRILDHLIESEATDAVDRIDEILNAITILESSPLIGRPTDNDLRELIIGRRAKGYVALYRYIPEIDTVFILAIRSQKEAGYK